MKLTVIFSLKVHSPVLAFCLSPQCSSSLLSPQILPVRWGHRTVICSRRTILAIGLSFGDYAFPYHSFVDLCCLVQILCFAPESSFCSGFGAASYSVWACFLYCSTALSSLWRISAKTFSRLSLCWSFRQSQFWGRNNSVTLVDQYTWGLRLILLLFGSSLAWQQHWQWGSPRHLKRAYSDIGLTSSLYTRAFISVVVVVTHEA